MNNLQLPLSPDKIRQLRVGDWLGLSGTLITARDSAHQYLCQADPPEFRELLKGAFIYHCGPIAKQLQVTPDKQLVTSPRKMNAKMAPGTARWEWVAAGPTTSMRMETYTPALIERCRLQGIIGKGGMGPDTQAACQKFGSIYCQAPGGCAALLAQRVVRVKGVYKLEEFGIPEAMWVVEVKDFPVLVTMDSQGGNLYQEVCRKSQAEQQRLQELASC